MEFSISRVKFIYKIIHRFSHIFPGLCSEYGEIKCSIILAGDPQQLNAVVKSDYAKQLKYEVSYMEFLMEKDCYKKLHSKCVVQLTENYRNHPAILHPASKLFYKQTLLPKASKGNFYLQTII